MELAIIGTGYVGLVTGACLAESGNKVTCIDKDAGKVTALSAGKLTFYEPGLAELVERNATQGRLTFSTNLAAAVQRAEIIFICVGTPPSADGEADTSAVYEVAAAIAAAANQPKLVITKSTVPVGTTDRLNDYMAARSTQRIDVVSNPEFLKQGDAVNDFSKPDHIIIGARNPAAGRVLEELYAPFVRTGSPVLHMDTRSSEMTKYATNTMLATRISLMNEMANLAEALGADIDAVRRGLGADRRIGNSFIFPGVGYGGSCLPKDVKALAHQGKAHGYAMDLCSAVDAVNEQQITYLFDKIERHFNGALNGRRLALWGLSYKPRTDDLREAPSLKLIPRLVAAGASIQAYDPKAMPLASKLLGKGVTMTEDAYGALHGADALVLMTEWNEFRNPDFARVKSLMAGNAIFDGRNIYDPARLKQLGFTYYGVGRN